MHSGRGVKEVIGVVLAAGAGTRFGGPKALARVASGRPWLEIAVATLREGGCSSVLVALGAGAEAAIPLVPSGVEVAIVPDWADGLSATVRATLGALRARDQRDVDAALLVPIDTPAMPAEVCARILASTGSPARTAHPARAALARAVYQGIPGHPVLVGREHWGAVGESVVGDQGAGPYLRAHGATQIECADLWDGADIDRPPR